MLNEIEENILNSRYYLSRNNFTLLNDSNGRKIIIDDIKGEVKNSIPKFHDDILGYSIIINNNNNNKNFNNLESKLLLNIFKNLNEKELSFSVCRVCRHWYRIARNPILWKKLKFKGNKMETIIMCDLLRKCKNLNYLSIKDMNNPTTLIRQMCRFNRSMKILNIVNCRYEESEIIPDIVLRNILNSCRYLKSLNLKGTQFYSIRFYDELANLTLLRDLNLKENNYMEAKNLISIALNCKNLKSISFDIAKVGKNILKNINDDDIYYFFETLSKSLKRIEIDGAGIGEKSFKAILNCENLEYLNIRNSLFLTGEIFSSKLSKLRYLKRICLKNACQLVSKDLILPNENNAFDNLVSIDLTCCCRICDVGIKILLLSCKDKLKYLNLKSCKSIRDLSIVIENCSKLEYLNIAHVFDSNITCVDDLIMKIPKLKKLVVDKKIISNNDLIKIKNRTPKLTIVRSMSQFYKDEATIFSNEDRKG